MIGNDMLVVAREWAKKHHVGDVFALRALLDEVRNDALETAARVVFRHGGCDDGVDKIRALKVSE